MPISRGSLRACSSQYDIRSADAFETFILSMEASNLSCCTVLLAWAMLLVLAVLLDIFDDSSFLKSARLCVGQYLQVLIGGVNQKSQLQIEKMLTPMSFPYEPSCSSHRRRVPRGVSSQFSPGSALSPAATPCEDPARRLPTHARPEISKGRGGACVAAPTGFSPTAATWAATPGPPSSRARPGEVAAETQP